MEWEAQLRSSRGSSVGCLRTMYEKVIHSNNLDVCGKIMNIWDERYSGG